jgi:CelD/BcsL family acetyltransferase involved in cellulose biosynthesis
MISNFIDALDESTRRARRGHPVSQILLLQSTLGSADLPGDSAADFLAKRGYAYYLGFRRPSRRRNGTRMRLEVVTQIERLAEVAGEWDELLSRCHSPHPTVTPHWLLGWWSVFGTEGSGRELRSALFWEGERLVGIAPLLARNVRVNMVMPRRRLELLASGEDEDDEICSDYIGAVADPSCEQPVAQAIADALVEGKLGPWDDLVMPSMDGARSMPSLLSAALSPRITVSVEVSGSCPYITLPSTWDAYLRSLGGRSRHMVRRSLRDLEEWAGDSLKLRCAETDADLERGRHVLESLHAHRWNTIGGRSLFDSERFRAFHSRMMPELFQRGELELLWLEAKGEPLAVVYNVVHAGKVYFYQSGRRMDLPKRVRVGIALHAYAIRRAIEKGRREYDFLAGQARYKLDLATGARPLCTLHAWAKPLTPHLEALSRYALSVARGWRDRARAFLSGDESVPADEIEKPDRTEKAESSRGPVEPS